LVIISSLAYPPFSLHARLRCEKRGHRRADQPESLGKYFAGLSDASQIARDIPKRKKKKKKKKKKKRSFF